VQRQREVGAAGEGGARGDGGSALHNVCAANGDVVHGGGSETTRGPPKRRGVGWQGQQCGHGSTLGKNPPEARVTYRGECSLERKRKTKSVILETNIERDKQRECGNRKIRVLLFVWVKSVMWSKKMRT